MIWLVIEVILNELIQGGRKDSLFVRSQFRTYRLDSQKKSPEAIPQTQTTMLIDRT